jgi:DNA-binding transcriptional MerR regulator
VAKSPVFVSVQEACDLLNRMERKALARLGKVPSEPWEVSSRQLRYLDTCGVLENIARVDGARLYTATDLSLMRLWIKLLAEGATESRVRAALVYLADDLRREMERPTSDCALLLMGARGLIVPVSECKRLGRHAPCLAIADVVKGTREAVEAVRKADARVWTGRRFETSSTLALAVVHG